MSLSPEAQKWATWFPTVAAGTAAGLTTHDLYSALANSMIGEGFAVSLPSPMVFNELRHVAVLQREAANKLSNAQPQEAIISEHIAPNIIQRTGQGPITENQYLVRFEHFISENGQQSTEWRTSRFTGLLPLTVGDLRATLERDGTRFSSKYESEHVGIGSISLLQI